MPSVNVRGGQLVVGEYGNPEGVPILAIHGITASHKSFAALAKAIPEYRILAPDLRGRGRSNGLPGPWGIQTHAEDAFAVLDALNIEKAIVVGHSMGALVSEVLTANHLDRVSHLLLIDGGLPLLLPSGMDEAAAIAAQLGPSIARLSMKFESKEAYRKFWHAHPAFAALAPNDSADLDGYSDYDLDVDRPSTNAEAVKADSNDLFGPPFHLDALQKLPKTKMLAAETWLAPGSAPLFSREERAKWQSKVPNLEIEEVKDVNHFTILMSDAGAARVAFEIRNL